MGAVDITYSDGINATEIQKGSQHLANGIQLSTSQRPSQLSNRRPGADTSMYVNIYMKIYGLTAADRL